MLLLITAVMTMSAVSAQEFKWGVKAGVNLASTSGSDLEKVLSSELGGRKVSTKAKIDFVGGLFGEYQFNERIGLGAELLYSGQGSAIDISGVSEKAYMDIPYLNIPVYANVYIWKGLAAKAGVQAGIPISKPKVRFDGRSETADESAEFDISIPVGLSYSLDCGLIIDARYNIGVT